MTVEPMTVDEFMASLGLPEVYRVGGSVRDELLGRPMAKDHDYMVRGASLDHVMERFRAAGVKQPKGLKLRDGQTVGVRSALPGVGIVEVVLPRKEVSTGPGHRDFKIVCDPWVTLEEDAKRRDFTINALYRNVQTDELSDPLADWGAGGVYDLAYRLIRTTHPDSFRDDPLRTLRALRFASTLGFELAESTFLEMRGHAEHVSALTLKGVSGTALSELCKLLMGARPARALRMMRDSGVFEVLLPELAAMISFEQESIYHDKTLDEHVFGAIQCAAGAEASLRVRLALLFHDAGKPWMAWRGERGQLHYYAIPVGRQREVGAPPTANYAHEWWSAWLASRTLARLNAPADLRKDVITLVERHMVPLHGRVKPIKVRTWRAELGDEMLADLLLHRACDVESKGGDVEEALDGLKQIGAEQIRSILRLVPRSTKELAISGGDLVDLGLRGPDVGDVQRQLLHEVMAQPDRNDRGWLITRAKRLADTSC